MIASVRHRLVQVLEVTAWLGAAAGIALAARHGWQLADGDWARAMLWFAAEVLIVAAVFTTLMLVFGIYHNTRRNALAAEAMVRQNAGMVRRAASAPPASSAQSGAVSQPASELSDAVPVPHRVDAAPRRLGPAN